MKQKPPHIDKELQTLMAMTLPEAMGKALESYNKFFDKDPDEGDKAFTDYHNASKAVLAHIQLLAKMSDMIEYDDNCQTKALVDKILENAENELEGKDE